MAAARFPKPAAAIALFALGAAVPYAVPALARYRLVREGELARSFGAPFRAPRASLFVWKESDAPARSSIPRRVERVEPGPAPAPESRVDEAPKGARRPPRAAGSVQPSAEPVEIENAAPALDAYFAALDRARLRQPGAVVRVSHFGDSPLTGDLISGEARARLQERYGDAGPGFLLIGRPWGWYQHTGMTIQASGWKPRSPLLTPGNSGRYGLSGVVFTSASREAKSRVESDAEAVTRVDVTFSAKPGGGHLLVSLDGAEPEEVPTAAESRATKSWSRRVPAGFSAVTLRPKGDGDVVVHGVALEREGPGLVYDALGANGGSVHFLSLLDADGWVEDLAARRSDLVILNYGTNESGYAGIPGPRYARDYAEVIARVRRALPGASILVMAPMDRGARDAAGEIGTMPTIPRIVAAQRAVAAENRCAFFDTFAAMGGEGTMARWYEREPRLVAGDFTHTTKAGSDRVARLLVDALEEAYRDYRRAGRERAPEAIAFPVAPAASGTPVTAAASGAPPPS